VRKGEDKTADEKKDGTAGEEMNKTADERKL
jgi:hypothetical protein